jgi:hypothetical protein
MQKQWRQVAHEMHLAEFGSEPEPPVRWHPVITTLLLFLGMLLFLFGVGVCSTC